MRLSTGDSHGMITIRIPKPRRSWLQFRLRTLMLLMFGAAMLLPCYQRTRRVSCDHALFGRAVLSPNELHAAEAAFAKAGLDNWDCRGRTIFVPRGNRATYLAALSEANCLVPEIAAPRREEGVR